MEDLEGRVAYTIKKASSAIIATSVTNFVAFLGVCFSALMPLSGFGIYAVIVVSIDYILIILVLPAYYIFNEKFIAPLFSWRKLCRTLFCYHKQQNLPQIPTEEIVVAEEPQVEISVKEVNYSSRNVSKNISKDI